VQGSISEKIAGYAREGSFCNQVTQHYPNRGFLCGGAKLLECQRILHIFHENAHDACGHRHKEWKF
jgi:hypothetical protein